MERTQVAIRCNIGGIVPELAVAFPGRKLPARLPYNGTNRTTGHKIPRPVPKTKAANISDRLKY